jgi:hypothetical protein
METNKIITNFTNFLEKQKCKVPKDFIKKYFILTIDSFVSFSDCLYWLNVERDNLVKTLKSAYKEGIDYFEIKVDEDNKLIKLNFSVNKRINNRRKYYKLTTDCFKKISMSSNSKMGMLTKTYYMEMERIVKDFSNYEMSRLQNENNKLKRIVNPKKISNEEGLYVWHYNDDLKYRIGSGKELQKRINQHDSSHPDDVKVDIEVNTGCYKVLESIVLKILDEKRYRNDKDFFVCDIKEIRKIVKSINDLLKDMRTGCKTNDTDTIKQTSKKSNKKKQIPCKKNQ